MVLIHLRFSAVSKWISLVSGDLEMKAGEGALMEARLRFEISTENESQLMKKQKKIN